jgi:chaperone BCS1
MTTNHIDVLDKALIRPGRIDIKINFQKCTCYDIQQMIKKFWDINIDLSSINPEIEGKYTNAEVINIFRSTNDFETIQHYFTL